MLQLETFFLFDLDPLHTQHLLLAFIMPRRTRAPNRELDSQSADSGTQPGPTNDRQDTGAQGRDATDLRLAEMNAMLQTLIADRDNDRQQIQDLQTQLRHRASTEQLLQEPSFAEDSETDESFPPYDKHQGSFKTLEDKLPALQLPATR